MPVKLSQQLVEEAKESAKLFHRSLTGQIEHWATLGRVLEARLDGDNLASLLAEQESLKITQASHPHQRAELLTALGEYLQQKPAQQNHEWLNELKGIPLYGIKAETGEIIRRNPDGDEEIVTDDTSR